MGKRNEGKNPLFCGICANTVSQEVFFWGGGGQQTTFLSVDFRLSTLQVVFPYPSSSSSSSATCPRKTSLLSGARKKSRLFSPLKIEAHAPRFHAFRKKSFTQREREGHPPRKKEGKTLLHSLAESRALPSIEERPP